MFYQCSLIPYQLSTDLLAHRSDLLNEPRFSGALQGDRLMCSSLRLPIPPRCPLPITRSEPCTTFRYGFEPSPPLPDDHQLSTSHSMRASPFRFPRSVHGQRAKVAVRLPLRWRVAGLHFAMSPFALRSSAQRSSSFAPRSCCTLGYARGCVHATEFSRQRPRQRSRCP